MILNDYYKELSETIIFKDIKTDSKDIKPGDIFVAIKGEKYNGHDFINEALNKKASFIISSIQYPSNKVLVVNDTKKELYNLLNYFYKPKNIKLIGVTGTDGKTTTSQILYHILNFQNSSSYIGTNGIITTKYNEKIKNTTPSMDTIYRKIFYFEEKQIESCVLEVSSEGIINDRIKGLKFYGAIFTNLTHEHLNSHKTLKKYFKAKASLFLNLDKDSFAIINADSKYNKKIKTKAKVITYGLNKGMYKALNINLNKNSLEFDLHYKNKFVIKIQTNLFGYYNIYNTLASIAYSHSIGLDFNIIKKQLITLPKIEGRFEYYQYNKKEYIIDFAHTPNSLYNLLLNINQVFKKRIILVLGCAGEKDTKKRSIMAKIACQYSGIVIFTSEDPKNENILSILSDMTHNLKYDNYYLSIDRKEAINLSTKIASINDIIVITGKGQECYENIKGYNIKHNDLEEIKKALGIT